MLPNKHHPEDVKWLTEQFGKLPSSVGLEVCGKYSSAYQIAFENEPLEHKKSNHARNTANTRLRKFVVEYQAWR